LYYINDENEKEWLMKISEQNLFISKILTKNGIIYSEVHSESFGAAKDEIICNKYF